jgi:hypothetical protein
MIFIVIISFLPDGLVGLISRYKKDRLVSEVAG